MNTVLRRYSLSRLPLWCLLSAVFLVAVLGPSPALPQDRMPTSTTENAASLLEKHRALSDELARNPFGRPLSLDSSESRTMVNGNAYAVLAFPFANVTSAFRSPSQWCEVMILHINTKYCRAGSEASPSVLNVNIGKKTAQDLVDSFALEFSFQVIAASAEYLAVQLNSDKGPLGTNNYRIELRAAPLADGKTFIHLRYSYGYGMTGRLAMQGYLATLGSGKVGFTQLGQAQKPSYVGGMRGAVERNTMRYYLAIEAYLVSLGAPPQQQLTARLQHWFNATEQYPKQLHEMDLETYMALKKQEYRRQQSGT